MKEIWFIRHAESASNANMNIDDNVSTPLTEKGHSQARLLAGEIKKAPDLVITTPYIRTYQTASYLFNKFPDSLHEILDLQEFTYLDKTAYKNCSVEERGGLKDKFWSRNDPEFIYGEGAESFSQVVSRIKFNLKEINARDKGFTIVFTHGFLMKIILKVIENPNATNNELMEMFTTEYRRGFNIYNCDVIKFVSEEGYFKLIS